jgi:hypothetical protein
MKQHLAALPKFGTTPAENVVAGDRPAIFTGATSAPRLTTAAAAAEPQIHRPHDKSAQIALEFTRIKKSTHLAIHSLRFTIP